MVIIHAVPSEVVKHTFTPTEIRSCNGGTQKLYRFANNFGASVVKHSFSYGTELAVIKFASEDINDFGITYDTYITDDVIGHLSEPEINQILIKIKNL